MQAVIITAYCDYPQLKRLVARLTPHFLVLVHIDAGSEAISVADAAELGKMGAYVFSKYKTFWGSLNHLRAVLDMAEMALVAKDVTHIHVLSGQDYTVRPTEEIEAFFRNNSNLYMTVRAEEDFDVHMRNNVYLYDWFQGLNTRKIASKGALYLSWWIQRLFRIHRSSWGEYQQIYQGLIWMSLPRDAWEYIVGYLDYHDEFVRDLRRMRLPEEYAIQTILMNSSMRSRIVNNNLRFDLWEMKNGSKPAILDESDSDAIFQSDAFFARKIDSSVSKTLIRKIDQALA